METGDLISQVKTNCNISDAKFWGSYSICGLLMRMRELYRSEMKLRPWQEIAAREIGGWIGEREALWGELEEEEYRRLTVNDYAFDPFDTAGINRVLSAQGMVYGAGLGVHLKPSFFLASLHSAGSLEGCDIFVGGTEYARDLSAYPAMLQGNTVFARREALSTLLWDRFEEVSHARSCGALAYAFSCYGVEPGGDGRFSLLRVMPEIVDAEIETFVHHEVGEAVEGSRLGAAWKTILADVGNRRVETFCRAVKDILSDTSDKGMLRHIISRNKRGSLGFYLSFRSGFSLLIAPEIKEAFETFRSTGDWTVVDEARRNAYVCASEIARKVLALYDAHGEEAGSVIDRELIAPLQR